MIRYSTCSNSKVLNILNRPQCGHIIQGKFYANTSPSENTEEDNSTAESIRNVARLPARFHRRMLHVLDTEAPSPERVHQPYWSTHENLKLDRKIYGLYGRKSGVNPGAMWPTKDDLEELIEKENEFEPSLQDRWKNVCMKKTEEERAMREKETFVEQQMKKMPELIEKFRSRLHVLEKEEEESEKRKQVLLDEAREYFGYKMDNNDPRFKEMQEAKAEEELKMRKKKKKEAKQARILAKLKEMSAKKLENKQDEILQTIETNDK